MVKNTEHKDLGLAIIGWQRSYKMVQDSKSMLGNTIHMLIKKRNDLRNSNGSEFDINSITEAIDVLDARLIEHKARIRELEQFIRVARHNIKRSQRALECRNMYSIGDMVCIGSRSVSYEPVKGCIMKIEKNNEGDYMAAVKIGYDPDRPNSAYIVEYYNVFNLCHLN